MDLLDCLVVKDREELSGTYYKRRPKAVTDNGILFQYEIVNESDSNYAKLLDSIKTVQSVQTIKTNDLCGFKIDGYICTQDGSLWVITGMIEKPATEGNRGALRFLKRAIEAEYIIRLMKVQNPWGLK